jgi:hypothetical protein
MHFDHLQPALSAPLPRLDDEDEDDDEETEGCGEKEVRRPGGQLIQRRFLEQRKIFLWGAVTDETAKDITEKLLYLEATAPGKEIFVLHQHARRLHHGRHGRVRHHAARHLARSPWSSPAWPPRWVRFSSAPRPRAAVCSTRTRAS